MKYLTLATSFSIAGVAAWYSIAGLIAIFSGSVIPIAIMGGVLEVGKLVTAAWLHSNWSQVPWLMRTYLTSAVAVLMFITSLGIFGFLSKAHTEQVGESSQVGAKVERLDDKIARFEGRVLATEQKIERIGDSTSTSGSVERSIARQEQVIDSAWDRIGDAIASEEAQIQSLRDQLGVDIRVQQDRIGVAQSRVKEDVQTKERSIERIRDEIKTMDAEVRALSEKGIEKGAFGSVKKDWTEDAKSLRAEQETRREELGAQIQVLDADITSLREKEIEVSEEVQAEIVALRAALVNDIKPRQTKIEELRASAQAEVDAANTEIQSLQSRIGDKEVSADNLVSNLEAEIDQYYAEMDTLREEKFVLESSVRDLEAEVGPLKYIAELIYGEDAGAYLDKAVRFVIILLVIVFDPLAVVLLLAASMEFRRSKKDKIFYDDGNMRVDPNNVVDVEEIIPQEPHPIDVSWSGKVHPIEEPDEWLEEDPIPHDEDWSDYQVVTSEDDEEDYISEDSRAYMGAYDLTDKK